MALAQTFLAEAPVDNKTPLHAVWLIVFQESGIPRRGVWGVQTPPEILKISVESSIA